MASKPTDLPRWGRTSPGVDAANLLEPTGGEKDTGYTNGQVPASSKLNWLLRTFWLWINWLNDTPLFEPTTANADGLRAKGNGTGRGAEFTGGDTGAAALSAVASSAGTNGSLHLNPQTSPTLPQTGEAWYDSTLAAFRGMTATQTVNFARVILYFSGVVGNSASTTYYLYAAANATAAALTAAGDSSKYWAPTIRAFRFKVQSLSSQLMAGGGCTIGLYSNGVLVGSALAIASGATATFATAVQTLNAAVSADLPLEIRVVNAAGVTVGLGQTQVMVELV